MRVRPVRSAARFSLLAVVVSIAAGLPFSGCKTPARLPFGTPDSSPTPLPPASPPDAVQAVAKPGAVVLSWNPVAGATVYTVLAAQTSDPACSGAAPLTTTTASTIALAPLPAAPHCFRIMADGGPDTVAIAGTPLPFGTAGLLPSSNLADATAKLASGQAGALFGFRIVRLGNIDGLPGEEFAISGPYYLNNGVADTGRIDIFSGSTSGVPTLLKSLYGVQGGSFLGIGLTATRALPGSGSPGLIGGAVGKGLTNTGNAVGYVRAWDVSDPSNPVSVFSIDGSQTDANFGHSVAAIPDLDGDGESDLAVGSWLYDVMMTGSTTENEGTASIYNGDASLIYKPNAAPTPDGVQQDMLGETVGAGDFNCDGRSDVFVGAPGNGKAYVMYAPYGSLTQPFATTVPNDGFSSDITSAGRVLGAGCDCLLVGAKGSANAYLYCGSPGNTLSPVPVWSGIGTTVDSYGAVVAGNFDVNGDGFADFLVGSPNESEGGTSRGEADLYLGGPTGPPPTSTSLSFPGIANNMHLGNGLGAVDVDGDGSDDLLIAGNSTNAASDADAVFVILGPPNAGPSVTLGPQQISAGVPLSVSAAFADTKHAGVTRDCAISIDGAAPAQVLSGCTSPVTFSPQTLTAGQHQVQVTVTNSLGLTGAATAIFSAQ